MNRPGYSDVTVESLLPHILHEAEQLGEDPVVYRTQLEQRLLIEQAASAQAREEPDHRWLIAHGDYRKYDAPAHKKADIDAPLSGDQEGAWSQQIDELLDRNRGVRPTIFLEFGAGFAVSLIRAGKQYAAAVESGDLILAATNLGYMPPLGAEGESDVAAAMRRTTESPFYDGPQWDESDSDFLQANQHRVQFMDANAVELLKMSITAADGETIPLLGNTSLISERFALLHTDAPEVALAALSTLLTDGGYLNIHAKTANSMHGPSWDRLVLPDGREVDTRDDTYGELLEQQRTGLTVGHTAIQNHFGMERLEDTDQGPLVYRKRG